MKQLTTLISALLFLVIGVSQALADINEQECSEWKKIEKQITEDLPKKIDEATELTNFMINCDTKVIKYSKRLLFDTKLLKGDWKNRKQRQHSNLHCNKQGIASTIKWTVLDDLYDKDFEYLTTFITRPNDC